MARVLISMPEKFLTQIDSVAEGENRTRSELIREALRTYINRSKMRETTYANKTTTHQVAISVLIQRVINII